jgi:DNA-binding CsgD family transcriptional regulator
MAPKLTKREQHIMNTIAQIAHEKHTTETTIVAAELGLQTDSLRNALYRIMQKAGVTDRGALMYWWLMRLPGE